MDAAGLRLNAPWSDEKAHIVDLGSCNIVFCGGQSWHRQWSIGAGHDQLLSDGHPQCVFHQKGINIDQVPSNPDIRACFVEENVKFGW